VANRFEYPDGSFHLFAQCGSAAEAYFLRPFVSRPGAVFQDRGVCVGDVQVVLQVSCALSRIDFVVSRGAFRLAIEVDGMGFHHANAEQVAADYLRERRIVCAGYTVIRFTAQEAFSNPSECWRQVDEILSAHAG